ncbi:Flp pilus assembly protein CpaB [Sphingobium nicotianae]|uniref:Flp pilus assembly protein CpaB n=1 Tax=Sphingobium nicotianae TaxID=2782607 RepID=A0A9X1DFN8_9SPHN|nr:Flp pilus assembly protein CpaB [Sphingobium nicotianae]MBT2189082.1 Flp pilus assembly protein CpaB [Sphingobium nicotianae]
MTPLLRSILFGIGALALIAGIFVGFIWLRSGASMDRLAVADTRKMVLVAARPIDAGTLLRAGDFVWRPVVTAQPQPGSFVQGINTETELVGALTRRNLSAGEVLTAAALLRPDERGFLAATLVPGFRAVTIPVDARQSASGLVLPGDRVDVILVQTIDGVSPARKTVSETLLSDARVVAVGHALGLTQKPAKQRSSSTLSDSSATSSGSVTPQTITLEARPLEVQRVVVAGQIGTLELALRPLGDRTGATSLSPPVWAGDVSAALAGLPPPPSPLSRRQSLPSAPSVSRDILPVSPPSVLIIRGSGGGNK